jgi:hypothetical protein
MFHARLICSDADCDETFEAWGTLEELQALACDCGCGLELLSIDESGERVRAPLVLEPCH